MPIQKVQVAYGRIKVSPGDTGKGFTYNTTLQLQVGDIVLVPETWLQKVRGPSGPQEATVVSTQSDYDGDAGWIIKKVE